MKKGAAVFDLDHTLIEGSVSYNFGSYLYRKGHLSLNRALPLLAYYTQFSCFGLTLPALHTKCFHLLFAQRSAAQFKLLAEAFLEEKLPSLIKHSTFKRLKEAQERGDHVAILSNSPNFLVEAVARRFGVAAFRGTCYEIDEEGRFSGLSTFIMGKEKESYLNELYARGYVKEKTAAYSDSYVDLPFLMAAGKPVAVNPDRLLKKAALKLGWEILNA
jgi:HAD superfamily hydrolase (TIGR01490 family)